MRTPPRRPRGPATLDVMRPAQHFGAPRASDVHDPRRWMRLVFLAVAAAAALLPLLGATTRALID